MAENNWTYIRIQKQTAKKLRAIKLEKDIVMYDEVLTLLLGYYTLEQNREASQISLPSHKLKSEFHNFKQTGGLKNGTAAKNVKG
jgi:adenosyl cobinamide kinase/adenosyl cobinamide phosphate guanylyltransferase